jgi:RimJ/RimL family protein N-acetyltransferase
MNAWRSMAMLLGHWALRGYGMWAVELADSGEFIGRVGLHNPEGWPDIELGWMLVPGEPRLRVPRAISLIRADNSASERVARRIGGRQGTTIDFLGAATLVYTYHAPDAS